MTLPILALFLGYGNGIQYLPLRVYSAQLRRPDYLPVNHQFIAGLALPQSLRYTVGYRHLHHFGHLDIGMSVQMRVLVHVLDRHALLPDYASGLQAHRQQRTQLPVRDSFMLRQAGNQNPLGHVPNVFVLYCGALGPHVVNDPVNPLPGCADVPGSWSPRQ